MRWPGHWTAPVTRPPRQLRFRAASRATLSTRFGLAPDAGVEDVRTAAMRAGLTEAEAAAIVQPAQDDADLVAAGRALVRVTGRTGEY